MLIVLFTITAIVAGRMRDGEDVLLFDVNNSEAEGTAEDVSTIDGELIMIVELVKQRRRCIFLTKAYLEARKTI